MSKELVNPLEDEESIPSAVNEHTQPSPEEEYKGGRKTRRKKWCLLLLFLFCYVSVCFAVWGGAVAKQLPTRVSRQIEKNLFGKVALSNGEYTGETDFGLFVGEGTFAYRSGASYDGAWAEGKMEGLGKFNFPDNGSYEGSFSDSQRNGEGTYTWDDGDKYVGAWKNDQMSGEGTYTSSEGLVYKGMFQGNALWEGTCTLRDDSGSYEVTYKNGDIANAAIQFSDGTTYQGECDAKGITGNGTMKMASGDSYEGGFQSGKREGTGTYTWANGDVYKGSWDNGSMDGSGSYTYSGGNKAEGTFDENKLVDGSFKMNNEFGNYAFTVKNGSASSVSMELTDGTKCTGDIKEGQLTGSAQITYGNGDTYSGQVEKGQKSGTGKYAWSNGASYEGSWTGDKMSGSGTYLYPQGTAGYKITGSFVDGHPDGECTYFIDSSTSYKTDWQNGKCVKIYE